MMKRLTLLSLLWPLFTFCQHDKHVEDNLTSNHNHLAHMQASRAQVFYIHNLPAPKLMTGIGNFNRHHALLGLVANRGAG